MPDFLDTFRYMPKEQIRTIYALIAIVAVGTFAFTISNKVNNYAPEGRSLPALQTEAEALFMTHGLVRAEQDLPRGGRYYGESRITMSLRDQKGEAYSGSVRCYPGAACEIDSLVRLSDDPLRRAGKTATR